MIVQVLKLLVKLFRINALVNRDEFDNSIAFEWWFKSGKKLSIDFYSLLDTPSFIENVNYKEEDERLYKSTTFVLYRKIVEKSLIYDYTAIELPWLYIYMS